MIIRHTDIISVKCPHCGYSEQCQSYDKQQVKDIKDKMRLHIRQCYYQRNRRINGEKAGAFLSCVNDGQSCPFWSSNENDKITYDSWEISDIAAEYELRIYSNEE